MSDDDRLTAQWLKRARKAVNADPAFRKLGSVDAGVGIRVGRAAYVVTFAAFECRSVASASAGNLRDTAFVIEMTPEEWQRFVASRRAGAPPTLAELDHSDGVVKARDARCKLDFYRYHLSVQAFFDAGAAASAEERAA